MEPIDFWNACKMGETEKVSEGINSGLDISFVGGKTFEINKG